MNELRLISDYKHNETYRLSFNKLAQEVFGINFEPWYQAGGWSDRYVCYSLTEGDRVVSNVSINKMDLIWDGQVKKALQIGTVMTHPEFRGRGLAASLMKTALAEHETSCDFVYLFGDASALSFYPKFGFTTLQESQFSLAVKPFTAVDSTLRKLDLGNAADRALFDNIVPKRVPISKVLGAMNDLHLVLFYSLLAFPNNLYYLEDMEAIVISRVKEGTLHLYDVISTKPVPLDEVLKCILSPEVSLIRFHFTPDIDNADLICEPMQTEDALFVKPALPEICKPFMFPYTSHA